MIIQIYGKRTCDFRVRFWSYFSLDFNILHGGVFNNIFIPLALVGFEMDIVSSLAVVE